MPETIAIIGAGPLGRRLALAAARGGFQVRLEDLMPQNLQHAQEWLRNELASGTFGAGAQADVRLVSTIEDAVREADLAIDCVPDELESKLEIFCLLDRMAPPKTVLATPTTHMSIADLASCTYRSEKCVAIAHDAATLADRTSGEIRLLTTSRTSPGTVALLQLFWTRLGFTPVFVADPLEAPQAAR